MQSNSLKRPVMIWGDIMRGLGLAVLSVSSLVFAQSAVAQSACPVEIGQTVNFTPPATAFDELQSKAFVKGEFEKTVAFKERLALARDNSQVEEPLLVSGLYDATYVKYDADAETFEIQPYAWDNFSLNANDAFPDDNLFKIESTFPDNYEVVIRQEKIPTASYTTVDDTGGLQTETEMTRQYGIFDRAFPWEGPGAARPLQWRTAAGHQKEDANTQSVRVHVPIDEAQSVKEGLQTGFYIRPKIPRAIIGTSPDRPSVYNPTGYKYETRLIVANILCAVIAGPDNKVLATARPGYRP